MTRRARSSRPMASDGPRSLPTGWVWCDVNEAGMATIGRQLPKDGHARSVELPYLRVANVLDDELRLNDLKRMAVEPYEVERYELLTGDILLCEGQSPELVGRCAVYRGELERALFQNTL